MTRAFEERLQERIDEIENYLPDLPEGSLRRDLLQARLDCIVLLDELAKRRDQKHWTRRLAGWLWTNWYAGVIVIENTLNRWLKGSS